jgi:hypothetical protein
LGHEKCNFLSIQLVRHRRPPFARCGLLDGYPRRDGENSPAESRKQPSKAGAQRSSNGPALPTLD